MFLVIYNKLDATDLPNVNAFVREEHAKAFIRIGRAGKFVKHGQFVDPANFEVVEIKETLYVSTWYYDFPPRLDWEERMMARTNPNADLY